MSYLFVPLYKGLGVQDMLARLRNHPEVAAYLPDEEDRSRLPRQWVINIFNSVVGRPFAKWVHSIIEERNEA